MRGSWGQGCGVPFHFRSFGLRCVCFRSFGLRCVCFRSFGLRWFVFVRSAFVVFVFVRSALVAFVSVRSALVVSVAPVTHLRAVARQTCGRCCGGGCVVSFVSFVFVHSAPLRSLRGVHSCILPSSPSRDVAVSTHDPPCEQWLAGLGGCWVTWHSLVYPPLTVV